MRKRSLRLGGRPRLKGVPTINLRLLRERAWQILPLDVPGRMDAFRLGSDRAEVIGIAAIVLDTLGAWLNLRTMVVPGVGVREGILLDLVSLKYSPAGMRPSEEKGSAADAGGQRAVVRAHGSTTTPNTPSR